RSRRFAAIANNMKFTPVKLLPGRFRLETRPSATGSPLVEKTIGIDDVAALAACAAGGEIATITLARRRTRSSARPPNRSYCPSAHRYSMATFLPLTYPFAANPAENASTNVLYAAADVLLRKPITGIGC